MKKNVIYLVVLLILSTLQTAKAQNQNGSIQLVLDSGNYEIGSTSFSEVISLYNNKTLLLAAHKKTTQTTPGYTEIFKSTNQGKDWEIVLSEKSETFGDIHTIKQTGENEVLIYYYKLEPDTANPLGFWLRRYYLGYSDDLGKTWKRTNLNMPLKALPSQMSVYKNEVLFRANYQDSLVFWHSKNKGATWTQINYGSRFGFAEPKIIAEGAYVFIASDSLHYTNNLQNPKWQSVEAELRVNARNSIVFEKDHLLSAWPKPSGIGNLSRSYIVGQTPDDGWQEVVDVFEPDSQDISRRGLFENAHYKQEFIAFVGGNLIYTSKDGGSNWQPFYVSDEYTTNASRGVVCMKDEEAEMYHLFYPLGATGKVLKYSTTIPISVQESEVSSYDVSIYPNPTSHQLNIQLLSDNIEVERIHIFGANGKLMLAESTKLSNNITINTALLPKGLYYAELHTTKGVLLKKLIKL